MIEYYSAPWCSPCKIMGPIIEELKTAGWDIRKIDIDNEPELAKNNNVQAVPTFIIYKENKPIKRLVGAKQKFVLENEFKLALGK